MYDQKENGEVVVIPQEIPTIPQITRKYDREEIATRLTELGIEFADSDTKGMLAAKLVEKLREEAV